MASKKITKSGGITIPKGIRTKAGIFPGNAVDIQIGTDGSVVITKHCLTCRFCGSVNTVFKVMDIEICKDCANKITKAVAE